MTQRLFAILNGDDVAEKDRIAAATCLVRVGERRSKLLGLDAAVKVDARVNRFADLSDAELIEQARRLGVPVPDDFDNVVPTQPAAVTV